MSFTDIRLDRLVRRGPSSTPGTAYTDAIDSFTDADGTDLEDHTPDIGGSWQAPEGGSYSSPGYFEIAGNKLKILLTGVADQHPYIDVDRTFASGDEIYWDFTSVYDIGQQVGFKFAAFGLYTENAEGYVLFVTHTSGTAAEVNLRRQQFAGGFLNQHAAVSVEWASGEARRVGVTLVDITTGEMDVWMEPAGGGERTYLDQGIIADTNLFDEDHLKCGFECLFGQVADSYIDNFTHRALTGGGTGMSYTLPYSVAVDGSEGELQAVLEATGELLISTRPSPTTIAVEGLTEEDDVVIGLRYTFEAQLSTIYLRNADYTGIPRADSRKRLQLQRIRFLHEDTVRYDVLVQGSERDEHAYPYPIGTTVRGSHTAPVLSNNELVSIKLQSLYPSSCWFTGADWEGIFKARSGLR